MSSSLAAHTLLIGAEDKNAGNAEAPRREVSKRERDICRSAAIRGNASLLERLWTQSSIVCASRCYHVFHVRGCEEHVDSLSRARCEAVKTWRT